MKPDAFAGYDELYKTKTRIEVGCWAHARRKFEELVKQSTVPGRAHHVMAMIGKLYDVERKFKALSYAERYEARLKQSKPSLAELKAWIRVNSSITCCYKTFT